VQGGLDFVWLAAKACPQARQHADALAVRRSEGGGYPMNKPITFSLTPEELKLLLEIVESHQAYFNWYPDEGLAVEYHRVLALLHKLRSAR
jgi:hypothetical protein